MAQSARRLHGALETLLDRLLADPDRLRAWGYDEQLVDLFQADPGFEHAVQVSRFDGLLGSDGLKVIEFNCDSPGGAARADALNDVYREIRERFPDLDLPPLGRAAGRVDRLHRALMAAYREWRTSHPDASANPLVVLTDWRDVGTRADIELTIQRLRELGTRAVFADPRELELDGDRLVLGGERVHLVYKRVILRELVEADADALLEAYRAGSTCVVNPPGSVLAGDKRCLAELTDPSFQAKLTPPQRAAVAAHVPWTRVLDDATVDHEGETTPLAELALAEQDRLVLKPAGGYGGEGVHLGPDRDPETWARLVDHALAQGDWILQRLVDIPRGVYVRRREGRPRAEAMNENVNPFVFGGRYAGTYTRVSAHGAINVSQGGAIAPTVLRDR